MEYEKLCRAVEQHLHREMHTPADFEYLSEQLLNQTGSSVSSATLMRLWGYRPSVPPRVSTLDILARFIGYNDYTQFSAENNVEESVEKKRRSYKKVAVGAAIAVALLAVSVLFYIMMSNQRQEHPKPHYITRLSELSNNRQYLIHTRKKRRGTLGICIRHLASTYKIARFYHCNKPSPFALIQHEGNFYLFSIRDDRFINILKYLTNQPLRRDFGETNWCAFDIRQERECLVIDFKSTTGIYTLNVNADDGLIVDDWGTATGIYDDGNLFMLEDVGPFDPTVALTMLQQAPSK